MTPRMSRFVLGVSAPLLALVAAFAITSLVLVAAGDPVFEVWGEILSVPETRNVANIIDNATVLYLSGIAVAIGFRMNLFNIGVDGQYRVAAFAAAVFAGQGWLPGWLNIIAALVVAMVAGGLWAGIAGLLKVTRGVSEVISMFWKTTFRSIILVASSRLRRPFTRATPYSSTWPSRFTREGAPSPLEMPVRRPSRSWMRAAKGSASDRSAKSSLPSRTRMRSTFTA